MEQRYIDALTNEYMPKLYYFCLKKTGNSIEAENLTSDILVNILSSLDRGNIPVNFRGWVWQIARNRYSLWAAKKHKKASWEQYEDISEYELESESESPEEELIQNEFSRSGLITNNPEIIQAINHKLDPKIVSFHIISKTKSYLLSPQLPDFPWAR